MYAALFSNILDSSIWETPPGIRVVWITLLAMASREGVVEASIPALAKRAGVDRDTVEEALRILLAADPDSRTKAHGGRRIEPTAGGGGWVILNFAAYRDRAAAEHEASAAAIRQQRFRQRTAAMLPAYSQQFRTFWVNYPRPVGKMAAFRAWLKAAATMGGESALLEAVKGPLQTARASEKWLENNGQYVPHPATWLNQRRWEDPTT